MTKLESNILLFSVTLCWSASYVFIKSLPNELSTYAYLTMTTGIAAIILAAIFWKKLKQAPMRTVKKSFVLSLILTVNLIMEKKGIELLPSSAAGFLSSLTILAVPLLMLLFRVIPTKNNAAGALIILLGLCMTNRFSLSGFINTGTLFMLFSCLLSAVYIILANRFVKQENPLLVGVIQMIFTALTGFLMWSFENPKTFMSVNYTGELLSSVFILAFFAKAYSYVVLMFSQKYTDPVSVTVIASTEPVVTLMLAVLIPSAYDTTENLNVFSLCGAFFITMGAVVAGTDFIKKQAVQTPIERKDT